VANPQGPYLGGPIRGIRGSRPLRLNDPPPGGFAPTPHKLRGKQPSHREKEEQRQAEQREERELQLFSRFGMAIALLVGVGTLIAIIVVMATH
jgi:hypothetical protein